MEKYLINVNDKKVSLENARADYQAIDTKTLAIDVFTDFSRTKPIYIGPNISADEAYQLMKTKHVRSLFIMEEDRVIGVITSRILSDLYVLEFMAKHNIRSRGEVTVSDLMINKDNIHAISYDVLKNKQYTIKDIIETFCHLHERHIFVTKEVNDDEIKIIGIMSATDIARWMNINIDPNLETLTFSSLSKH